MVIKFETYFTLPTANGCFNCIGLMLQKVSFFVNAVKQQRGFCHCLSVAQLAFISILKKAW